MCATGQARADLFVLFAFNLEVARAPWVTAEPMIAEMRLQWWADALGEIGGTGPVRRHEVVTPLADVVARCGIAPGLLEHMIAARRFDVYRDPPQGADALDDYIRDTAGGLARAAAQILGAARDDLFADAGFGLGAGNLLRAVPELAARGRKPLPLAGLSQQALMNGELDDVARGVVADLVARADAALGRARAGRIARVHRPAVLTGWRGLQALRVARRDPMALFAAASEPSLRERTSFWTAYLTGRW